MGVKASSDTFTGRSRSWNAILASGYSPVKVASSSRVKPETWFGLRPLPASYGGMSRASSTRATGLRFPICAQMLGKRIAHGLVPCRGD